MYSVRAVSLKKLKASTNCTCEHGKMNPEPSSPDKSNQLDAFSSHVTEVKVLDESLGKIPMLPEHLRGEILSKVSRPPDVKEEHGSHRTSPRTPEQTEGNHTPKPGICKELF